MSESLTGHVIGGPADTDYDGAVLTADLAIGDTVLHVDDTADFDEDASLRDASLVLNVDFDAVGNQTDGTALAYATCDDDAGTVTLAATSPLAASTGDRVYLQDPVSGGLVGRVELLVSIDGGDSTGDPVPAYIDVALLEAAGDVDLNEMAVELDEDEDGQLYVSGFPGLVTRQGDIRGWDKDGATATGPGDLLIPLTYRPLPGSTVHVFWCGLEQRCFQWELAADGYSLTVFDPDGLIEADQWFTVTYLTRDPRGGVLSIPIGTMWKYATGLGSSTAYASPVFDDSAWDSHATPVQAPFYVSPGNVWQRIRAVSLGGDLTFTMAYTDNRTSVYLDGALVYDATSWSSTTATVTVPCAPGVHTIAVYSVDTDGPMGIGQGTGIAVQELATSSLPNGTVERVPVGLLDPAGAPDGYAPIVSGGRFILDDPGGGIGLPWFMASAYGASEAGTNAANRAALNAAIADLNAAGKGVLYIDGRYTVDVGLTAITAHANIFGDGAGDLQAQNAASSLKMTATTGYLLTLAGDGTCVENLALENPTTTTQTSGAGIRVTQGDLNRYRNVSVRGFFNNVQIEDGALWTMRDCYLVGAKNYGLYIRHIDLPDGGDMVVEGCSIYAEDRNAVAAIRWETGGGLKLANNKINTLYGTGYFTYGLDATITSNTAVLTVTGNSFENLRGPAVRGQSSGGSFQDVSITGNQIGYYNAATWAGVDITGWRDVTVVGNTGVVQVFSSTQALVKLTSVVNLSVGLNTADGFTGGEYALTSCSGTIKTVPSATPSLTVQDEGSSIEAATTQINFVGPDFIATTDGAGHVTVTHTDPTVTTSSGELLMADGVTGPPVPIETEGRDDWLYQG